MKVVTNAIVSNSDMIKNYKACREKAEDLGKIFVFKNNQPDAVLFSILEYERISKIIEVLDNLDNEEIIMAAELCQKIKGTNCSTDDLKKSIKTNIE